MEIITRAEARERGLTRFFTGLVCKNDHTSERLTSNGGCVECIRDRRVLAESRRRDVINQKMREYRAKNAEKMRAYDRSRRQPKGRIQLPPINERRRDAYRDSPDKRKQASSDYYYLHRDSILQSKRLERIANQQEINAKQRAAYARNPERVRLWNINRRRGDPAVALSHRIRTLIRGAFIRTGYRKSYKTEQILGCSIIEFRAHLERQFLTGMTWENRHLWHIDHIVPLATAKSESDVLSLNHFTNLRPLWAKDNLTKRAKITHLI